jgi:dienelactone hydrolase
MLEKGEEEKIKVPVLLSMSEMDPIFTDEIKSAWIDGLKKKDLLDRGSQTYPKSVHGHAIRPDLNKPEIKRAFEESLKNAETFFSKVLA